MKSDREYEQAMRDIVAGIVQTKQFVEDLEATVAAQLLEAPANGVVRFRSIGNFEDQE